MHAYADAIVVALIAVIWPVWENAVNWPQFLSRVASRDPSMVRIDSYRYSVATQWGLCVLTVAVWAWQGHAWTALPLFSPVPWRIGVGVVVAAAVVALMLQQVATVRGFARARATVRRQIGDLEPFLPLTPRELAWFRVLSVTAGVCEEWLYRGVLTTLLAVWLGLPAAVALAGVAFGFAHAYQGWSGIARTAMVGLCMSGIVLLSGSLVPAMIVHAAIDLGSGQATHIAMTVVDEVAE
jgi:membrane protease YdiL (CAAX protease family)